MSLIKGLHLGFVRSVDSLRLHQNLVVAQDMMLQALPGSIEYAAGAGTVKELRDQIDDVSGEG